MPILRTIARAFAYAAYTLLTHNRPYTRIGLRATIANALFKTIYTDVECDGCGAHLGGTIAISTRPAYCRNCTTPAPITVSVLHATSPTFLGTPPTEPTSYRCVARKTIAHPVDDTSLLEELFKHTNSIDEPWIALAQARGFTVPVNPYDIPIRQRSTSVGDIIGISGKDSHRYFLCQMDGWVPIDSDLVHQQ